MAEEDDWSSVLVCCLVYVRIVGNVSPHVHCVWWCSGYFSSRYAWWFPEHDFVIWLQNVSQFCHCCRHVYNYHSGCYHQIWSEICLLGAPTKKQDILSLFLFDTCVRVFFYMPVFRREVWLCVCMLEAHWFVIKLEVIHVWVFHLGRKGASTVSSKTCSVCLTQSLQCKKSLYEEFMFSWQGRIGVLSSTSTEDTYPIVCWMYFF